MNDDQREAYVAFAAARWRTLVRSAVLLGCDLPEAEDLAQATLLRCFVKWSQVERAGDRDAYVARVMLNLHRQSRRRRWWREVPSDHPPDPPDRQGDSQAPDGTETVHQALAGLSREHREVVVLRIYLELPERETAAVLGIPAGTVKSRLARALARLATDPDLIDLNHGGDA